MNFFKQGLCITLQVVTVTMLLSACSHIRHRTEKDIIHYGIELARDGYWHEAALQWKKVAESDPDNASVINNLAIAAEAEGLTENARKGYEKALQLSPENPYIKKNFKAFEGKLMDESTMKEEKDQPYDRSKNNNQKSNDD